MKKNIELLMAKQFAELAVCNLDAVMKDDSLTDKEFNDIREAHDSIASAYDTIKRLTKPQRMVSAEAKEIGYGESDEFGEYINELSKQFTEVSFAKLSRIAVRVKNWLEQTKSK